MFQSTMGNHLFACNGEGKFVMLMVSKIYSVFNLLLKKKILCLLSLGDNMDWLLLLIILLLQLSMWISFVQKLDARGLEVRSEADAIFLILFGNFFWYESLWKRRVLCSNIPLLVFQLPKSKVDESRWQYV